MKQNASQNRRRTLVALARSAIGISTILALTHGNPAFSAVASISSPADGWHYADIADLFLESPIVLTARILEAIPVEDSRSATTAKGTIRYYLVADVVALIRGTGGVAPRVAWIADVPVDGRGKAPRLKKTQVILSALPVTGRPGEVRLAARDAMVPWSAPLEARIRDAVASGLATDGPPRITGIASAFHSPGNLPREGETQFFLTTTDAQPVSINVLRRPGIDPQWAVALGEIVDEAARPPAPETLGWYRLACFLPGELPATAVADLSPTDTAAARADYGFVMQSLGPCARVRAPR